MDKLGGMLIMLAVLSAEMAWYLAKAMKIK